MTIFPNHLSIGHLAITPIQCYTMGGLVSRINGNQMIIPRAQSAELPDNKQQTGNKYQAQYPDSRQTDGSTRTFSRGHFFHGPIDDCVIIDIYSEMKQIPRRK